jgi:hypothetical protein
MSFSPFGDTCEPLKALRKWRHLHVHASAGENLVFTRKDGRNASNETLARARTPALAGTCQGVQVCFGLKAALSMTYVHVGGNLG